MSFVSRSGVALTMAAMTLLVGCGSNNSENASTGTGELVSTAQTGSLPPGAVMPTPETIESGEYKPLSRPLFLYVNRKSLQEKPALEEFLEYYLSDDGQELVTETGYVRLSSEQLAETKETLQAASGSGDEPKSLSGEVLIDGSSTVAPITTAVAEEFSKKHRDVRVPVAISGTGGGFKNFVRGETDINNASRPIKESEIEACKEQEIEFVELKVAIDGLTVVVNPENDWVAGMTIDQLRQIWEPNSSVSKWSDVDPNWPDEEIKLFGPDTDSGTFEYFTEEVCGEAGAIRSDYQQSADDNFLVTGVTGDKHALGYFGYAYFVENQSRLKALAVALSGE